MRLKKVAALLVFLAVSHLSCDSLAATTRMPRFGMFVYSNFCRSPMSGDLYGVRVSLHRFWDGDLLVYEYTDGSTHALVADALALDDQSHSLRFKLNHPDFGTAQLSGQLSEDGQALTLRGVPFEDANTAFKLKRRVDLSAPAPECKSD